MGRPRWIVGVHQRHRVGEVQVVDDVGAALVQVDRARMHQEVRRPGVHGAEQPPGCRLDHGDRRTAGAAQVDVGPASPIQYQPLGRRRSTPAAASSPAARSAGAPPNSSRSRRAQRQFGGGGREVWAEHVRVRRVEHARLHRPLEQRLGMVDQVGVERVVAGHQDAQRRRGPSVRPGRPAATSTRGGPGSRP